MFNNKINYRRPRNMLMLFQILGISLLFMSRDLKLDKVNLISSISLILITFIVNSILARISTGDNYIFLITSMLFSIGSLMIYRINPEWGFKQIIWIVIGIIAYFSTYFIMKNIKFWDKLTILYGVGAIGLFILTLLLADRTKGSRNWISIFGVRFQPTELTKILLVFMIASFYSYYNKHKKNKYNSLILMGVVYLFIGFLFLQKDLGTVVIFYGLFLCLQFIYEEDRRLIFLNIGLFLISAALGLYLFDHVKIRVLTWIDPWKYIDNKGYQITQSLFAIASGGFFGTGIGLGHPDFIPEVHTDFIFSAICEEMGIFTGMGVIMLFLILVYRGFKIAINQEDQFYRIVALGISILFGIQTFIIIGGVTKLIPLTGITIPFVSYGGTSILSSFISLAILQVASENLDLREEEDGEGI